VTTTEAGQVQLGEQGICPVLRVDPIDPVELSLVDEFVEYPGVRTCTAALGDIPDGPANTVGVGAQVVPGDGGAPRGGLQQRGEHAQRCRLAGSVGAEEPDDLAGGHREVNTAHG